MQRTMIPKDRERFIQWAAKHRLELCFCKGSNSYGGYLRRLKGRKNKCRENQGIYKGGKISAEYFEHWGIYTEKDARKLNREIRERLKQERVLKQ